MEVGDSEVFIGIGVGKSEHWATAPTRAGRSVCDKALPNDEVRPPALYKVPTEHGSLPVVVDQPATIGAPAVAVAQDRGPVAAVFLAETLGKTFNTGALLASYAASYAGLAPLTRRSGSSIRGASVSHAGNKRLKRAVSVLRLAAPRLPGLLPAHPRPGRAPCAKPSSPWPAASPPWTP